MNGYNSKTRLRQGYGGGGMPSGDPVPGAERLSPAAGDREAEALLLAPLPRPVRARARKLRADRPSAPAPGVASQLELGCCAPADDARVPERSGNDSLAG